MEANRQALVPRKLWEHPDPKSTLMWRFMQEVNEKSSRDLKVSSTSCIFTSSSVGRHHICQAERPTPIHIVSSLEACV